MSQTQSKLKSRYDVKSQHRAFAPGQKVLLFLPVHGNPLASKFSGPYVISHKVTDLNYVVHTPDRRKNCQLVHIDQIKPYFERQLEEDQNTAFVNDERPVNILNKVSVDRVHHEVEDSCVAEKVDIPSPRGNPSNSHILSNFNEYV
ncbi:hypothetical protein Pcinc_014546 [Petrolisthes cinctipes]|uniref:Integrase p58-like C-terminal domain-containing protein n=1 Tax=Petrolisthes cinctipes TaxID=88211 RepID=A0AAE1FXL1_PETCI|nr:hypothetical protein Pcinc_014546 [Petrolisthes cinctipes]